MEKQFKADSAGETRSHVEDWQRLVDGEDETKTLFEW